MSDFRDHIAVIDYGMGNLHSVSKALEHVRAQVPQLQSLQILK